MDIFSLRLDHYPLPFDTPVGRRAGVGAHYEVKNGSEIAKYYMAGSTHIAMRKYTIPQNMTVEYFLSDHLGSTSLTADANGNKVLELRYKAWGEIRATWTSSPSTTPTYKSPAYTYTGQYSYMDDPTTSGVTEGFGLMFYRASIPSRFAASGQRPLV